MKKILFVILLHVSLTGLCQPDTSLVKFKRPTPNGYSHAAVIDLGNCQMIVLSGQVPLNSKGNLVGKGDLSKQTEQVFLNIQNTLSELGGGMDHLVKIGIYMIDVSQIQQLRDIRNKFINAKRPPASTLVQVSKLFRDDVLVEIEATAIIPKTTIKQK